MEHRNETAEAHLRELLPETLCDMPIFVYKSTDSTMTRAKMFASACASDAIFVAEEQTEGVGRLGRRFVSERGRGLFASLLIHPDISAAEASMLTPLVAVCLCRVLQRLTPLSPKIKWVNDVYIGERKLSGILTRAEISDGRLSYAVIGVGVNLSGVELPSEIADIATTVERECGERLDSHLLCAELVRELYSSLSLVGSPALAEEYREQSMLLGRRVSVSAPSESYEAVVRDIDGSCRLIVELRDGSVAALNSGEVSIRLGERESG